MLAQGLSDELGQWSLCVSVEVELQEIRIPVLVPGKEERNLLNLEGQSRNQGLLRGVVDSAEFNERELLGNLVEEAGESPRSLICILVDHNDPNVA